MKTNASTRLPYESKMYFVWAFTLILFLWVGTKPSVAGITAPDILTPTANAATNVTTTSFTASWSGIKGADYYKIYVSKKVKSGSLTLWLIVTGYNGESVEGTSLTVSGLTSGATYKYYVRAIQSPDESDNSNEILVTLLPEAPVATAATNVTPTSFTANWNGVSGATSYLFYMNDQETQEWIYYAKSTTGTSMDITGLTPNRQYMYRVTAVNSAGNSANSNMVYTTTLTANPPTANSASSITANSFVANWSSMPGASSYLLRVTDDATQQFVLLDQEVESTSFTVTGLSPNSGYRYAVKAKFGDVLSNLSNWVLLTTKPSAPVVNQATNITTSSFTVSWNAVSGATGYKLWVYSNIGTGYNPLGYFPKTLGAVTSHSLSGLESGHSYSCYVQTVSSSGESLVSNVVDVITVPVAPVATEATDVEKYSFVANWNTVPNVSQYKLSVWNAQTFEWVSGFNGKLVTGNSCPVAGLQSSTNYQYSLKSVVEGTESGNSNYISVTTDSEPVETFQLALSASPSGGGTVSGGGTFNEGTTVTAHATANKGYEFVNWTEKGTEVSTSASYSFLITSNRTLVANFKQTNQYTVAVSVSPVGSGTVSGGGTYEEGASVTISAVSSIKTYHFVNWTENGKEVSTSPNYTFTISSDRNLVANFSLQTTQYTLAVSASPSIGGTVSGGGTFNNGTSVTAHASANSGYEFVNWTENGTEVSTSASFTFTITSNRTLVANFKQQVVNVTLSLSVAPSAGGSVSGAGTFSSGSSVTAMATAATGYEFVNWTENGTEVSTSASFTFTITSNRTLVANFEQQVVNVTLSLSAAPGAGGSVSGAGTFSSGSSVTAMATAATGYEFVNWTENGTEVSTSASFTFTITSNRTLVANFSVKTFTISLTANPTAGGITNFASDVFNYGQTATVNVNANANYQFVNWTENGVEVSTSTNYSFTVISDRNLVANFSVENAAEAFLAEDIKFYPNPVTDFVTISGIPVKTYVSIMSPSGVRVRQFMIHDLVETVVVSGLRKGIYFVVVENQSCPVTTKLIVK